MIIIMLINCVVLEKLFHVFGLLILSDQTIIQTSFVVGWEWVLVKALFFYY